MNNKEKIKNLQKEILINKELINDLKHYDYLSSIFKLMILITLLGIYISIFSLTKPLSLVLPPLLSIVIIFEVPAKVIYTGGTGSKKKKRQEIAFYEDINKEYEEEIKVLQQSIALENANLPNISSNKLIPNYNLKRKLVRQKQNY